jgi:hypothetical protein
MCGRCDVIQHICIDAPETLAFHFVECFVDNADPFILAFIMRNLTGVVSEDKVVIRDTILQRLREMDCMPPYNNDLTVQHHWSVVFLLLFHSHIHNRNRRFVFCFFLFFFSVV